MTRSPRTPPKPSLAEVYRHAAWCLENKENHGWVNSGYACIAAKIAVCHLNGHREYLSDECSRAVAVFKETFVEYFGSPRSRNNRAARIVALCLLAAMVEAGDA